MISRFYKFFSKYKKTIYCNKKYCSISNHIYKPRDINWVEQNRMLKDLRQKQQGQPEKTVWWSI